MESLSWTSIAPQKFAWLFSQRKVAWGKKERVVLIINRYIALFYCVIVSKMRMFLCFQTWHRCLHLFCRVAAMLFDEEFPCMVRLATLAAVIVLSKHMVTCQKQHCGDRARRMHTTSKWWSYLYSASTCMHTYHHRITCPLITMYHLQSWEICVVASGTLALTTLKKF